MSNPYFSFKQFTIYHDLCAMKVGIDGVLLGAWADVESADNILDIGTGTGLIALMLAQRSKSTIAAIDIEHSAILQAKTNVGNSPWSDRVNLQEISLQEFARTSNLSFDLIVSNPPYFVNSLKTPIESRTAARHADLLTHAELIDDSMKLLSETGRVCLILPFKEGLQCIEYSKTKGLYCTKKVTVYPKPNIPAKRLLIEFSRIQSEKLETELTIESEHRHHYSPEFSLLAQDFYLKL